MVPSIEVWRRPRQMQDEAADRAADVNAEFEQPVAQPRHLGAGVGGACGAQAEFLHEHVGGGRQEDAQLVRPELAAARTVDLQTVEQLLDAVLDIAAGTVDLLVDKARRLAQIGDDEARVVARLAVGEPHDFGFDHDRPSSSSAR